MSRDSTPKPHIAFNQPSSPDFKTPVTPTSTRRNTATAAAAAATGPVADAAADAADFPSPTNLDPALVSWEVLLNNHHLNLGGTFKRYHAENTGDRHTQAFIQFLRRQCINITATSLHSSQQNSLCERRFQTLFNTPRAALKQSQHSPGFWSFFILNAIDKNNFLFVNRSSGQYIPPNASILPIKNSLSHFLPFDQHGHVLDSTPKKPKLAPSFMLT